MLKIFKRLGKKVMLKKLHLAVLLILIAHSQGQSGFISLDCGLPENSTYTEATTKISYISDATFVEGGESKAVLAEHKLNTQEQGKILRSFSEGTRNCYNVKAETGTKYLIRATFYHGNYDGKNSTPEFDLHLGPNFWETVKFEGVSIAVVKEVIHFPVRSQFQVCLVNTGSGTPFINALEFRPLKNSTYTVQSESLVLVFRMDIGSTTNRTYRYPYDVFDRLWVPYAHPDWKVLDTSETVDERSHIEYQPPNIVMNNAGAPMNASLPFALEFTSANKKSGYFLYMHFAEIQKLDANQSRAFNVVLNGRLLSGPVSPVYLTPNTVHTNLAITGEVSYTVTLEKLENSTLPPIVNGVEIYVLLDLPNPETDQIDVDAVMKIKSTHGLTRNWGGDPCLPLNYTWTGLNCSVNGLDAPRITSLDLSSSGLTGEIPTHIANLSMLESLDLSNNNLTGSVPKFLTNLTNLKVLNLAQNNLTGVVPPELIEKSKSGFLSLSVVENPYLCLSLPCNNNKKKKVIIPIMASIGGFLAVLAIVVAIFVGLKRKKKQVVLGKSGSNSGMQSLEPAKRQFAYSEIVKITKNFDRVLGRGGFGTVYHGILDDGTEVAVKQIRSQSDKGSQVQSESGNRRKKDVADQQFQAEVKLLLTVYHGNLTSLVGYCNQGTERVLIYEYMANGDLESYLSGKQGKVLSWEARIQIAIDSAQGLEYLHSGCKPPIIHRDIKPANILLTENYRAKLADFGLSKFFKTNDVTHVFTMNLAGTFGYMDPELANNGMVNEKSDVYSFGVVLLQIITSRPTISTNDIGERRHVRDWVCSMLDNGNIRNIVDEQLRGDFEINSVWKAVEIAVACVSATGSNRPNMTNVAIELRECLALELDRKRNNGSTYSSRDDQISSLSLTPEFRPLAR